MVDVLAEVLDGLETAWDCSTVAAAGAAAGGLARELGDTGVGAGVWRGGGGDRSGTTAGAGAAAGGDGG